MTRNTAYLQWLAETAPALDLPEGYHLQSVRHAACEGCQDAALDAAQTLAKPAYADDPECEAASADYQHYALVERAGQGMPHDMFETSDIGRTVRYWDDDTPERRGCVRRIIPGHGYEVQWRDGTYGFVHSDSTYNLTIEDAPMEADQVDAVRAQMEVGARIRVIKTLENYNGIRPGVLGTVRTVLFPYPEAFGSHPDDPSCGVRVELDDGTLWAFLYSDDAWERVT